MSWRTYWEGEASVYVNARHKAAHYRHLSDDLLQIAAGLGQRLDTVTMLDFGCGEALSADRIAARIGHLTLMDASSRVRDGLVRRFGGDRGITILDADGVAALAAGTFDLIVVNSVLQYVAPEEASALLASLARLLKPGGRLLVADVLPPDLGVVTDARELIAFAARERFLAAALAGLVRTAVSDYARVRAQVGLNRYSVTAFKGLAREAGLLAEPLHRNIGHNPHRLAFLLRRADAPS